MKRILTAILTLCLAAALLTSCKSRQKVDISGMTSLADLNGSGAVIAAQSGTFHLTALQEQLSGVEKKEYKDFPTLLVALKSGALAATLPRSRPRLMPVRATAPSGTSS